MANEIRLRQNFLSGTVTDNPLTSGATTVNSANLASLVAVDSASHAVIVLDPDGVAGAPEVVYVTAHSTSATSATIVRGREGSSARQHASGTPWVHGSVKSDFLSYGTLLPSPSSSLDDFDGSSLGGAWTRVGYVSGDESYRQGRDGSWLQVTGRAAGNYYYMTAPGGDFVVTMRSAWRVSATAMWGILITNSSGNGIGAGWYNSSPDGGIVGTIVGGGYTSGFTDCSNSLPKGTLAGGGGEATWLQCQKSGNTYRIRGSIDGELWLPWSATYTPSSFTPTRVGFGGFYSSGVASFGVDLFDVA